MIISWPVSHRDPIVSASQVLGLRMCTAMHGPTFKRYFSCVCWGGSMPVTVHVWWSEKNLQELVLSLHCVDPGIKLMLSDLMTRACTH